jgi:hypothetical protein
MKVLVANATLATRTGTETYVRDLATGLRRHGHELVVYAPELGKIATELRLAGVPVVDDLRTTTITPDIIQGNHNTELMTALLHFPHAPAVFVCHSSTDWNSAPPKHPRIVAYVAVDDACRDRLVSEHEVPEERLRVVLHGVDQERFKPRPALPDQPQRALVFSNNANEFTYLSHVRKACDRAGIALDVVGSANKSSNSHPEALLPNYDLVFAKARCALESLVVGAAVILCDARGSGPMVTTIELERLRRLNFGIRTLTDETSPERLLQQIERYDARDANEVSRRLRSSADLSNVINETVAVYQEAINHYRNNAPTDALSEARATADYLRWLTLTTRRNHESFEAMFANSATLRFRNVLGRFSPLNRSLKQLGRLARGRSSTNRDKPIL